MVEVLSLSVLKFEVLYAFMYVYNIYFFVNSFVKLKAYLERICCKQTLNIQFFFIKVKMIIFFDIYL